MRRRRLLLVTLVFGLAACDDSTDLPPVEDSVDAPSSADFMPLPFTAKVSFKDADGERTFSIKPAEGGAKLVDKHENEMARLRFSPGEVRVKDAEDRPLGRVRCQTGRIEVVGTDTRQRFEVTESDAGDWVVTDETGAILYRMRRRVDGWKIEDDASTQVAKIKVKGNKVSWQDTAESTVLSTKDAISDVSLACLSLERIESLPLRVALALAMPTTK